MRDVAFTFEWYGEFLEHLRDSGRTFAGYRDAISDDDVLLRHDVDWSPRKAERIAELEAAHDAQSTFFFLVSSPFYNVMERTVRDHIRRISELGHSVGLHFSTHQYCDAEPEVSDLHNWIGGEFDVLSVASEPSEVVSFHNPPEWVLEETYEGFVSTYEPRFFHEIEYAADSNQRWRDEDPFADGSPSKLQVLTHPVLWGDRDGYATDRLREERDYHFEQIAAHLERTDRTWDGPHGLGDRSAE